MRIFAAAAVVFLVLFQARAGWPGQDGPIPLSPLDVEEVYGEWDSTAGDTGGSAGAVPVRAAALEVEDQDPWAEDYQDIETISDPLEPLNRAFYHFNDKLYFWVLEPAARGYRAVVPEKGRVGVRNFFYNLGFPIRLINCLLQLKGQEAGYEFVRFFVNSTVGMAGFLDVAGTAMELDRYEEDLGQTFGHYGAGPSIFINWPFFGPSCVRDSIGMVGDAFLNPVNYLVPQTKYNLAVKTYDKVNETSLTLGDYEELKRSALDPYVSLRDAYFQHRRSEIEK